jgi:hypothetical protein
MKDFWDERYGQSAYAYGEEPNIFFQKHISQLPPGKLLMPADGEGRNGVYAATLGWDVTSFDLSEEGRKKALALAKKNHVHINYSVGPLIEMEFEPEVFDAIGLFYAHFSPEVRTDYHHRLAGYLKKGGHIILEAFSKNHESFQKINPTAGGPKVPNILFTVDQIASDFKALEIIELKEEVVELNEGRFHQGPASVIRFFGRM